MSTAPEIRVVDPQRTWDDAFAAAKKRDFRGGC